MTRCTTLSSWIGVSVVALACSRPSERGQHARVALGVEGIQTATPAEVGLSADVLQRVSQAADQDPQRDLDSVLVARAGRLVVEAYFNGASQDTLRDVRSVAKSLTGILVGIALHDEMIPSLDTSIQRFFPAFAGELAASGQAKIRVRDLLEMRSGLDADDWRDAPERRGSESRLEGVEDRLAFALQVPVVDAPGERWRYASVNSLLLGRIVEAATGRDLGDYAREKIFEPLGVERYEWRRDPRGHTIGQGNLVIRARDLLALGLLLLQGGRWHGRSLVPERWIAESQRPRSVLAADTQTGLGDLYEGYGYHWWTSNESTPAGPVELYFASGNGGQKLFVVPALQLVVVVTGAAYNRGYAHRRSHRIMRAVLAAVVDDTAQPSP